MATLDQNGDGHKNQAGESAPLLQQHNRDGNISELQSFTQQQQQQQHYSTGMPPQSYDANASDGYYPPPGISPIIIHSPNQTHPQLINGSPTTAVSQQPPFFYPFPQPQQNRDGKTAPYPFPPPPPPPPPSHILYQYQHQQQQKMQRNSGTPSSGLPALSDIFGANNGYGSTGSSPKVYNAPAHSSRLPPSGRAPNQMMPLKSSSSSGQKLSKNHRRVHSDNPLRVNRSHRRAGSGGEMLPPRGAGGAGHNRSRTSSGGNLLLNKPRHRRANSAQSYNSMVSYDSSMVSMRSNIAKSSLFGGIDEQGRPILYYPYEAIRLVTVPCEESQRKINSETNHGQYPFTIGHLYSDGPKNIEDYFEDYHRMTDYLEQGVAPQWESLDTVPTSKGGRGTLLTNGNRTDGICTNQCCTGRQQDILPPTNYVIAIDDSVYKRMLSEVAESQSMPCGLFFCGHHEDVDYPSIWIPGTLVIIIFASMIYISYCTGFT